MNTVCDSFGNSVNKVEFAFVPQEMGMLKQYEHKKG